MVNGVLPIVNEAPSGSPSKVPTIGSGALDDRELLAVGRCEAERGVESAPSQIDRAVHIELAVAGACGRAVQDDRESRPHVLIVEFGREFDVPWAFKMPGSGPSPGLTVPSPTDDRPDRPGPAQGAIPGIAEAHRTAR